MASSNDAPGSAQRSNFSPGFTCVTTIAAGPIETGLRDVKEANFVLDDGARRVFADRVKQHFSVFPLAVPLGNRSGLKRR